MDNVKRRIGPGNNAMPAGAPRISIVTVCFDAEAHIEQTIESVLVQTYPNIEHVVVDGGSTDGTSAIIERYADRIAKRVSEPDDGIADAMNKGVGMATGDFILFLHADDYLLDKDTVDRAVREIDGSHDFFLFSVQFSTPRGFELRRAHGFRWLTNFKLGHCHQGAICRRALFQEIGPFDTSYRVNMDYDHFMRAYRRGKRAKEIDFPIAVMRDTGVSSRRDWHGLKTRFDEERRVHETHCPGVAWRLLYWMYWALYLPYRRVKTLVI